MRGIYVILLVLVIAASALGCVGKKPSESTVNPATPVQTPTSPGNIAEGDFGTDNELAQMDAIFEDSSVDISFSEVSADAFT